MDITCLIIWLKYMVLKVHGGSDLPILQCINPSTSKWLVLWDKAEEEDGSFVYKGGVLESTPTIDDIKDLINTEINNEVSETITQGLVIDGHTVYLSLENQLNYKAAYDLAVHTEGKNLPVIFKFGVDYYKSFSTIEELEAFYMTTRSHIDGAILKGWEKKKAIDYSQYEALLV